MADGKVVIDVVLDAGGAAKGVSNLNSSLDKIGKTGEKTSLSIGKIASALGLVYVAKKGIDMVRDSLDGAITRYDTLNQFPRVLQLLGFDAEESDAAIQKLSDGIDGLPTTLDSVASTAQNIAIMTGDLDGAVDTTLALNNAFMASGSSAADANRGLQQYVQMLSKGEVDLQSWRTLQETMGVALNKLAEEFGFTGKSAQNDLYDALKSGEITFDEFNAKLIEASNAQGGFADMAKEASGGIKTSWTNVKTAVVKGVADVIEAIDKALGGVGSIENMLDGAKAGVKTVFAEIVKRVPAIVATVQTIVEVVKTVYNALEPWLPLIGAVALGITAAVKGFQAFYAVKKLIDTVKLAFIALNTTMLANPWFWVVAAIVAAAVLVYVYWEPISEFFVALWGKIKEISIVVWDAIKDAWKASVEFLKNAWNSIAEFFSNLWDSIVNVFLIVWEPVKAVWDEVVGYLKEKWQEITEFFTQLWNDIYQTMTEVWEMIKPVWDIAIELLTGLWETFVETFSAIWESIVQIVMTYWEAITSAVEIGTQMTLEIISVAWEFVKSVTLLVFEVVKSYILTVWDVIMIGIRTTLDIIKTVIKTAWEIIKTVIDTVLNNIKIVIQTVWNIIKGIINTVLNILRGDIRGAWNSILSIIRSVLNGIRSVISNVWNAIRSIISSVMSGIGSIISSIWNSIRSIVTTVVNSIKSTISNVFNSLKGIVSSAFSGVRSAVSTGIRSALSVITGIASSFYNAGRNIVTSIAKGITGAIGKVTDAIGKVTEKVRGFLPFSPAKYGALRDIMKTNIAGSIAETIERDEHKAVKAMQDMTSQLADEAQVDLLSEIKGITANSMLGGIIPDEHVVRQSVISSQSKQNRYDDSRVVQMLKQLVDKDGNVYINGEKVGSIVDKEQARRIKLLGGWVAID